MKIDFHTHVLPPEWPDLAERYAETRWPRLRHLDPCSAQILVKGEVFREVTDACYRPERRLEDMAEQGLDMQVLSTVPVMFSYWADPKKARELCRYLNENIAETVRRWPGSFVGLGTVPLGDPELAVEELERCVGELGLSGVEIGTNVDGVDLDDERLGPFFERAAELGAVVFVHPWQVIGGQRLTKYYFQYTAAMPSETAYAAGALIFGGVLEGAPDLKVVFAHGGGSAPYVMPRMQRGWEIFEPAREHAPRPPGDYLSRCFFDSITYDAGSLEFLVKRVGADHVFYGSDYPFAMAEDEPGATVRRADLTDAQRALIFGGACAACLGLEDRAKKGAAR